MEGTGTEGWSSTRMRTSTGSVGWAADSMPSTGAVVGSVAAKSVAAEAGLKPGDRIVSVDGQTVSNWEDFSVAVLPKANKPVTLDVERAGQRTEHVMTPRAEGKFEMGEIGVLPIMHPEIIETNKESIAAWAASRPPGGCATGASAGSATGARRSRSSIALPAASCPCRRRTCRCCCRKT